LPYFKNKAPKIGGDSRADYAQSQHGNTGAKIDRTCVPGVKLTLRLVKISLTNFKPSTIFAAEIQNLKMRSFLFATGLSIALLTACDHDDNNANPLGIGYSDPAAALTAMGTIDQQNAGPKVTYTVDKAFVASEHNGVYLVRYKFTSNDSLDLVIVRRTTDYNYHSDNGAVQNQLSYAIFDQDTLELEPSAVSIQPRPAEDRFETVINVHTVARGDFNGTVNGVPLINR
jgi:hypothetical protein